MEDVDHVVVGFKAFDKAVDVLLLLGCELAHREGDALELERLDLIAIVLKVLGYGAVVLEIGIYHNLVLVAEDLVDVAVDKLKLKLVHIDVVAPSNDEAALAFKEKVVHTHRAQLAFAANESGADVGDGTCGVVGGCLDHESGAVRTFAIVDDLLVGRLVLLGGALDGAFHVLFGHTLALGGLHQQSQSQVARRVGAAGKDGQFYLFSYFGEGAGHMSPPFQFSCFAVFKCSSHWVRF